MASTARGSFQNDAEATGKPARAQASPEFGTVAAAAFTGDDGDLGMGAEPCLDDADLAIRQKGDDAPPLQVADQRALALPAAERPIANADHVQEFCWPLSVAPYGP
jgi:hypothetical protein